MCMRIREECGRLARDNYEVNVSDMRRNLRALIERVEAGEEIAILRYGEVVARLIPIEVEPNQFPDLTEFRASIELRGGSPYEALMQIRDEYRY